MTKPIFKLNKNKTGIQLSASGDLNAQHAREIKAEFLRVLNESGEVHLALDNATAFDVAAAQLAYLLKKRG